MDEGAKEGGTSKEKATWQGGNMVNQIGTYGRLGCI